MAQTAPQEAVALDADGMDRGVGFIGLLWASEGSIIGSGWLFGALTAASIAGPSAIIAWVIASFIVILLALVHAELGGLFPVSGGTSRFPHYAFGSLAGATFGWFAYIQAATVAPIEVLAAIQYLSSAIVGDGFFNAQAATLTGSGIVVAIVLMVFFVVVNLIGIRWLARVNNSLTTWKVAIPLLTIIVFLLFHFHGSNFTADGGFFIHGSAVKAIMIAIPTGGIVFSLLGFEQAVQLGGESRNPERDLPARGHHVDPDRVRHLHPGADRLHRRPQPGVAGAGAHLDGLRQPDHGPGDRRGQAAPFYSSPRWRGSRGWRSSCASTRWCHRPAPA